MTSPRVLALLAGAALAAHAPGCSRSAPPPMERPPASVSVARAVSRDVPLYLDEIGRCVAREVVNVQPQVSGPVVEIAFADGAEIKRGDLLFRIDPRPFQARLEQAKAALAQRRAAASLAKTEFERVKSILDANAKAVSRQDFDVRENAVAVAEAELAAAEAAEKVAALDVDYASIRSPIDGRAGQRLVDAGNMVTSGESTLVVIQRLDPIYADFTVAERDLAAVRRHMAGGALQALVRAPGDADAREGPLTFLDSAVQDRSGTVKLRATLPNADRRFWPGQFVEVRLVLRWLTQAVLVPSTALQLGQKGPYVYVVKADLTAEMRPVKPGQRHGDLVACEEGVRADETVVTDGQIAIVDGGKVRVAEPPPAGNGRP